MSVFDPGEVRGAVGGFGSSDAAQAGLMVLIRSLSLAIGLWVETRGEAHCRAQSQAERHPNLRYELGALV